MRMMARGSVRARVYTDGGVIGWMEPVRIRTDRRGVLRGGLIFTKVRRHEAGEPKPAPGTGTVRLT